MNNTNDARGARNIPELVADEAQETVIKATRGERLIVNAGLEQEKRLSPVRVSHG